MGAAAAETGTILSGMAASPGQAEGVAHVALTAEEGNRIEPGQILVARFTDPGWTPIFPLAAAVVTDIGGRLSHGAIVAREYGIPAVVNVREATSTIVSGQQIRVDGVRGTVEILSNPP
jgi:pyruvate,water dikinase